MKQLTTLILSLSLLLVFSGIGQAKNGGQGSIPNPDPGQDTDAATPNLSFPVIATDIIDLLYQRDDDGNLILDENNNPIEIRVEEPVISALYSGGYPGNDGFLYTEYVLDADENCPVDDNLDGFPDTTGDPMLDWLQDNGPWYPQPTTEGDLNKWQADWKNEYEMGNDVFIDFIDWGNPMENINPIVGLRFPVEIALYAKLDEPMAAYKMACLEYPASRDEVFGTSAMGAEVEDENGELIPDYTQPVYFATVLTNCFTAEVQNPDGTSASINLEPGIGPSGKMNFASAGGGWIPTMPGWHRIWLHLIDPLISLDGAIVNNDEHYIMTSGCMAEELSQNKLELSGIVGDSTYIDVLVVKPNGKKSR